ncbi:MAG: RluA family pseudouridine synthase [Clostridia bacterium]|nr:RluA family pseudouridine synthase [Clostridia bacterium]
MLQLIVDKEQSLKEFTENNYAQASFSWNVLLKNKDIKVNGKRVGADCKVYQGDEVCYYLTAKQAEKPAFYTVYKDDNVLVVDKESGVNSEAVFAALAREEECYFIHRLDRNTKGLLIFARNGYAETELLAAFKEKRVEKRYHALCFGSFEKSAAVLTAYLKKDAGKSLVRVYDKQVAGAEKIVTEYKILESADGLTRLEVILHTGKTHQIRAHLSHIGCPIVGDMKYGDTAKNKALNVTRQCLVAKELRLSLNGNFAYLNDKQFISRFHAEKGK